MGRWKSRPTRARGLKHCSKTVYSSSCPVAPHAGAWIETSSQRVDHHDHGESRPTRARGLKHDCLPVGGSIGKSRPTRARGLKHVFTKAFKKQLQVAPHAGAWIETGLFAVSIQPGQWSRPTRARGLKPQPELHFDEKELSRPTRARGLKQKAWKFTDT